MKTLHLLTNEEPITGHHIGNQTKKNAVENLTGNVQSLVERRPIQRSSFLHGKVIQPYLFEQFVVL